MRHAPGVAPAPVDVLAAEITLAAARLAEAGVTSPRADAEQIAAHVHRVRRGELHAVPDAAFDARFWEAVARRAAGEPLQHITGRAGFRYLDLAVGPGVFLPRPETEVVAGWAIDAVQAMDAAEPVVVDLGTGSAAIALAVAQEAPRALVHAVEVDPRACAWAERNIARCAETAPHTAGRVTLHRGDFADALHELDGAVDLVVANPPYVPDGAALPPEVSRYDPPAALWGGADGLRAIRDVARAAGRLVRDGGAVAVEHGAEQGNAVYWAFHERDGWQDTRNHRDLAGRDRFVTARRQRRATHPWQDEAR